MLIFHETKFMLKKMPDFYQRVYNLLNTIEKKYKVKITYGDRFGLSSMQSEGNFYFDSDPNMSKILKPYNSHNNPFCNYIRTAQGYERCIHDNSKSKVCLDKHKLPFYFACYMGIEEFRFPVLVNNKVMGSVLIGQFSSNLNQSIQFVKEKAQKYGYDVEKSVENYIKTVRQIDFDKAELINDALILCDILGLYYLTMLEERIPHTEKEGAKTDILQKAMHYINVHYHENIALNDVAKACYCNPTYLSGLFQKKIQIGYLQYLNTIRINNAKTLLLIEDLSIRDIAERVGFATTSGFIKKFKKLEGITPHQSRKQSNT